jgi:hypothetical protein
MDGLDSDTKIAAEAAIFAGWCWTKYFDTNS